MSIFKETIKLDKENQRLIITVSCNKRVLAKEEKKIYNKKVDHLIPAELKGKVKAISAPQERVSNLNTNGHTNHGTWIFEIQKEKKVTQKPVPSKARTRRSRTRTITKPKQNKEEQNE